MNNTDKLLPRERVCLMNAIAERDKLIAEKDRLIDYYRRTAEIATERRIRERHDRSERRKDIIAFAVLLLVISAVFVPMMLGALRQLNLWLMVG